MVDRFDIYKYRLPLIHPMTWGNTQHIHRTGLLICLSSSSYEGWGEISPLPGFSQESLMQAIEQAIHHAKLLLNSTSTSLYTEYHHIHPSVLFGFELAHHNLRRALDHQPPTTSFSIASSKLVPHELRNHSDQSSMNGYQAIKLKVGRKTLHQDIDFVHYIHDENPDIKIRIDANRGWTLKDAMEFVDCTRGLRLDYIEEPLIDTTQLFQFAKYSPIPLALDETLRESDAERYKTLADVFVIKPTLFGGRTTTLELINLSQTHQKRFVISSSYESGVGMLGLLELAHHCPDEIHGLDTYQIFQRDVFTNLLPLKGSMLQTDINSVTKSDLDISSMEVLHSSGGLNDKK